MVARLHSRHVVNASEAILRTRHPSIFIFGGGRGVSAGCNRFVGCARRKSWVFPTFTHPCTFAHPPYVPATTSGTRRRSCPWLHLVSRLSRFRSGNQEKNPPFVLGRRIRNENTNAPPLIKRNEMERGDINRESRISYSVFERREGR